MSETDKETDYFEIEIEGDGPIPGDGPIEGDGPIPGDEPILERT